MKDQEGDEGMGDSPFLLRSRPDQARANQTNDQINSTNITKYSHPFSFSHVPVPSRLFIPSPSIFLFVVGYQHRQPLVTLSSTPICISLSVAFAMLISIYRGHSFLLAYICEMTVARVHPLFCFSTSWMAIWGGTRPYLRLEYPSPSTLVLPPR